MKKQYYFILLFIVFGTIIISCSKNEEEEYIHIVNVDLTKVPFEKLSDYNFFKGELKQLNPNDLVLPYEPISSLFVDYAHKKRFVWMPPNKKGVYNGDTKNIELPVGAVLIKTFYYDNVQNITPINSTRIIETRLMIRKSDGWIFANYVWNSDQTEAYLDLNSSQTEVIWNDENNQTKTVNYRIPNDVQCFICHKSQNYVNGGLVSTDYIPIGIKPQNLNRNYNYGNETKNQITKWIEIGYLRNNFSLPTSNNTVVDYNDPSKSLELRVRSYFDINCAHCHNEKGHCYYRPMRFNFTDTENNLTNLGVCVDTQDTSFAPALNKIVAPGNTNRSMLFFRLSTMDEAHRMPLHGRTIVHNEGVALVEQWINTLQPCQ